MDLTYDTTEIYPSWLDIVKAMDSVDEAINNRIDNSEDIFQYSYSGAFRVVLPVASHSFNGFIEGVTYIGSASRILAIQSLRDLQEKLHIVWKELTLITQRINVALKNKFKKTTPFVLRS